MKKVIYNIRFILIIFILSFFGIYNALSQPYQEWATKYNDNIGNDYGNDIALDEEGNIYVTGVTENSNSADYITIKYNPEGTKLWHQSFNGSLSHIDEALAIEIDKNGNIIVTGKSKSSGTGFDILTIKYNTDGIQLWTSVFNGSDSKDDIGYDLITDNYGNIYVCGAANTEGQVQQGIVLKYSHSGNLQWTKYFESGKSSDIAINSYGNIVVSSGNNNSGKYKIYELSPSQGSLVFRYNSSNDVNSQISGFPDKMICGQNGNIFVISSAVENTDQPQVLRIVKYPHAIGTPSWIKDVSAEWIKGIDLKIDDYQNLYVLADHKSNGQNKFQTLKYNSTGSLLWENFSNPSGGINDHPVSLALSSEQTQPYIYVTGYNSAGDIYSINYNSNGDSGWTKLYNCYGCSAGPDVAASMISDRCEKIYITGYSNCDGTAKDIKTIKYSVYELPQISNSGSNSICEGDEITLSTDPCDGCSYMWSTGETTASITISPMASQSYTVAVTNAKNCKTSSAPVLITVNPPLSPVVSITTPKTTICSGENVTFVAKPVDGGAMPVYNWYVDGELKSTINSRYFSSKTLSDGCKVYCIMTSTAQCRASLKDTSNVITMSVNQVIQPGVTIESSHQTICTGQIVNFTALPTNGGTSPAYEWFVDGQVQSQNSSIFSTGNLVDGSEVYAKMKINESCSSLSQVFSNKVDIKVNAKILPSVEIESSANPVCEGEQVTLTASPLNGGSFPTYKWYLDDEQQAGNTEIFTSSGFSDGSVIKCLIISNADCLLQTEAFSNEVKMIVNPLILSSVSIETSSNIVNECDLVTFTAIPYSSGSSSTFKWYINDELIAYGPVFSSDSLDASAKIYCTLSSDEVCVVPSVAYSDTLTISIKPLLKPEIVFSGDTISVGTYYSSQYSYLWHFNGEAVSTSPYLLCSQFGNGSYYLIVKNNYCVISSDTVNISCNSSNIDWITDPEFSVYPNPASVIVYLNSPNFKNKLVYIKVHDMLGNNIIQEFISFDDHGKSSLNISKLKDGAYILFIFDNQSKKYWFHKLLIN